MDWVAVHFRALSKWKTGSALNRDLESEALEKLSGIAARAIQGISWRDV